MKNPERQTENMQTMAAEDLYNLSALEAMDDNEYVAEILNIFLRDTPAELKEMKTALHSCNAEIIALKAHKIKGSAGALMAMELCSLLDRIEKMAKTEAITDSLKSLIQNVYCLYNTIEQSLRTYVQELEKQK